MLDEFLLLTENDHVREEVPRDGLAPRIFRSIGLVAPNQAFNFNVTRCKYAETDKEMGLGHIGHLLSCNRDGTFCQGYNPNIKLVCEHINMEGSPCCTFRYINAEVPSLPHKSTVDSSGAVQQDRIVERPTHLDVRSGVHIERFNTGPHLPTQS